MNPEQEEQIITEAKRFCKERIPMAIGHLLIALTFLGFAGWMIFMMRNGIADLNPDVDGFTLGFWMGTGLGFLIVGFACLGTVELIFSLRAFTKGTPMATLLVEYHEQLKNNET